ncbi:MAG TPA: hypothetical protein VJW77_00650 [Terriglobia bacterium]|nr:hypothetical protein [Terriglobia bacterium]HKT10309.1 hypothetical protein [Terriglobia bacterium]
MIFDSEAPKPKTGIRKYWPLVVIIIVVVGVIGYFAFHNLPEKRAVAGFLTQLEQGNYQQAYKLWQPAPDYTFDDFMHDWGPKGDYGKVREFKIIDAKSKGSALVIVAVTINNQTPALALLVDRKSKGLAYSPY